jgi:RNA recognition motif-containing protein
MSIIKDNFSNFDYKMSVYIPRLTTNINQKQISQVFERFGKINTVDLVYLSPKINSAYIHFDSWFDVPEAREFQRKIVDEKARIYYDESKPYYWMVLKNKSERKPSLIGGRKKRICIDSPTENDGFDFDFWKDMGRIEGIIDMQNINPQNIEIDLNREDYQKCYDYFNVTYFEDIDLMEKKMLEEDTMTDEDWKRCEDHFYNLIKDPLNIFV